ncbi:CsbD family protein [Streptomyces rhizosphaerihabitans]|uniref:CsbD family protein n=1 Tax=Streptomyces rhizosphaerihabitans TaxID=1266770 RepID=UPI0021BFE55D|nr:CsbD family protein [Streptomyces rhizosphaerihabitans]MCT9007381.1 CsbD family protein [Streptomyces rhizosphaerihabitans]WRZ88344.1 CsbD family protein [Streptomyces sp. NBC_01007]
MSVGRTVKNRSQEIKGRITEALGRATRNGKLERRGKVERISGNLRQAGEKARQAFKR